MGSSNFAQAATDYFLVDSAISELSHKCSTRSWKDFLLLQLLLSIKNLTSGQE